MTCEICDYASGKIKVKKLYEDDDIIAAFNPRPAVFGHVIIFPKKHLAILPQVPENVVKKMFVIAQQLAGIVFESLGAEGTNIMINEGVPAGQKHAHMMIHVIPRKQGDGLSFEWPQKQIPEDSMAKIYDLLKVPQEIEKAPEAAKEQETVRKEGAKEGAKDYLLRALKRTP
jgi:histidine triad (HIT) family protein